MHQLVYNDLFKILLLWICCIQKQNGFSVIAVNFKITGFSPCWVFNKFKLYVPRGCDSQLFYILFEKSRQRLFIHCIPPKLSLINRLLSRHSRKSVFLVLRFVNMVESELFVKHFSGSTQSALAAKCVHHFVEVWVLALPHGRVSNPHLFNN